jgi:hypothetical protein
MNVVNKAKIAAELGLELVPTSLLDDPDHHYGRVAPDGCVAIRVMDQYGNELRAASLPDPGDNRTGWKCWTWFWVRADLETAQAAIDRREFD